MISLLMWWSYYLQEKQFPITLTKQLISPCTFPFQNLLSHYVVRYQVVQSCTCKEYSKNIQFLVTFPYYNSTTYTSCGSLRNIYMILNCITSYNHNEDIYRSYHKLVLGLLFSLPLLRLWPENGYVFSLGSRARNISRIIKQ